MLPVGPVKLRNPVNAFDGNLTTTYTNPSTYNASYAWNGSIPFTTLKITYYTIDAQAGSAGVGTLTVNGSVVRTGDSPGSTYGNRNPYTEDFSSLITSPLTSIAITTETNGSSAGVYGIEVDGKVLKDGTVLTFNSPNPDLQYFQVGDVVQTDDSSWRGVISAAHPLKACTLKDTNGTVAKRWSAIYGLKINGQELIEVGDEYS